MGTSWPSTHPWLTKEISQTLTAPRDKSKPTKPPTPPSSALDSPEQSSFLHSLLRSAPFTTHKFHNFKPCSCPQKDLSCPFMHCCCPHITHQHTLEHSFCKECYCGYHSWRPFAMSTLDLSSCTPSSVVTSSAPLPISVHISSPEQHTTHLPGHLSLREHNFHQVSEVTKDIACIALATTNSWGFPLSPTSVQNVLTATPNPSPDQFWSIISGLANTIWIRDDVHWEKVEGLEAQLAVLQQRVDEEDDGLEKCPPGYEENWEHFPNFHHPLGWWHRAVCLLHQAAWWWKGHWAPLQGQGRAGGMDHQVICIPWLHYRQANGAPPQLALILTLGWLHHLLHSQGCHQQPQWLGPPCQCPPLSPIWPGACLPPPEDGTSGSWHPDNAQVQTLVQGTTCCHLPHWQGQAPFGPCSGGDHPVSLEEEGPD